MHVLVEKPFVTELDEARELVELAEQRRLLLGVVQNWRTRSAGQALKRAVEQDRIGSVSHVVFRYLRDREAPHLPDYLFDEPDPILWAMGVHHLDLFRYALGEEIVRVEGRAARPLVEPLPCALDQRPVDGDERRRRDLVRRVVLVAQRPHPAGVASGRGRAGHDLQRQRLFRAAAMAVAPG